MEAFPEPEFKLIKIMVISKRRENFQRLWLMRHWFFQLWWQKHLQRIFMRSEVLRFSNCKLCLLLKLFYNLTVKILSVNVTKNNKPIPKTPDPKTFQKSRQHHQQTAAKSWSNKEKPLLSNIRWQHFWIFIANLNPISPTNSKIFVAKSIKQRLKILNSFKCKIQDEESSEK